MKRNGTHILFTVFFVCVLAFSPQATNASFVRYVGDTITAPFEWVYDIARDIFDGLFGTNVTEPRVVSPSRVATSTKITDSLTEVNIEVEDDPIAITHGTTTIIERVEVEDRYYPTEIVEKYFTYTLSGVTREDLNDILAQAKAFTNRSFEKFHDGDSVPSSISDLVNVEVRQGDMLYADADGTFTTLAGGTSGYILQTTGTGVAWVATSSLGLSGGGGGSSNWTDNGTHLSPLTATDGISIMASSTIGDGTSAGGLTIAGNSTTTMSAYIGGSLGIGTTSPSHALTVTGDIYFGGNVSTLGTLTLISDGTPGGIAVETGTGWDTVLSSENFWIYGDGSIENNNFSVDDAGSIYGSWAGTVIDPSFGGTGINTSGETGFPYITAGSWGVTTTVTSFPEPNSLDFTEFMDALTLDASTTILATGMDVLSVTNDGIGNSFMVNDEQNDTSPFVIDESGNVGIGGSVSRVGRLGIYSSGAVDSSFWIGTPETTEFAIDNLGNVGIGNTPTTDQLHIFNSGANNALVVEYTGGSENIFVVSNEGGIVASRDVVLDNGASELLIQEAIGGTFYGTIDVGDLSADRTYTFPDLTGTVAFTANNLSAFATTTSAQLAGVLADETGSGLATFNTNPLFTNGQTGTTSMSGISVTSDDGVLYGMRFYPRLSQGSYNPLSQNGDAGIIFMEGGLSTGGLVLAPWSTSKTGIRITATGNVGVGSSSPSRLLTIAGDIHTQNNITAASGTIAYASTTGFTSTNADITNATTTTLAATSFKIGSDVVTDITGTGLSITNGVLSASASGGSSNWLFNGSRLTPSTTVGIGIFASSTIGGGTGATGLTISGGATTTGNAYFGGNISIAGNILPLTDDTYDLGSTSLRFRDLYLGPATLHIGSSLTDEATFSYDTGSNIFNIGTDSTSNGDIAFFTDDLFIDKSTGYVGVGTTTPGAMFTIGATTNSQFKVSSAGTVTDGLWQGDVITSGYLGTDVILEGENISLLTNNSGYITDGNTGWDNSYGYITDDTSVAKNHLANSGTLGFTWSDAEVSNTLTASALTSMNISQFTNNSGYITDGNTGWDNSYGYITDGNTNWDNSYGYITTASIDTSAELATIVTNETGTGNLVFSAAPTLTGNVKITGLSATGGTDYTLCVNGGTGALTYANVYGGCVSMNGDIAENYGTDDLVERGDIVILSDTTTSREFEVKNPRIGEATTTTYTITTANVRKATYAQRDRIIGAVPTAPNMIGSDVIDPEDNPEAVALVGHVPIHMTLDGGDVAIGDPITISSTTPGAGMKAQTSGRIIGYALEDFTATATSGDGMIEVYISPSDYVTDAEKEMLTKITDLMNGTTTPALAGGDTFWSRIVSLASHFVDGVLTLVGLKADEVETGLLCIGETCVNEDTLKALLLESGQSSVVRTTESTESETNVATTTVTTTTETSSEESAMSTTTETGTSTIENGETSVSPVLEGETISEQPTPTQESVSNPEPALEPVPSEGGEGV